MMVVYIIKGGSEIIVRKTKDLREDIRWIEMFRGCEISWVSYPIEDDNDFEDKVVRYNEWVSKEVEDKVKDYPFRYNKRLKDIIENRKVKEYSKEEGITIQGAYKRLNKYGYKWRKIFLTRS